MLGDVGSTMGFKLFGAGYRRNPIRPLPAVAAEAVRSATGVVLTHRHPDHLDREGMRMLRERKLPVYCTRHDERALRRDRLDARLLVEALPGVHAEEITSRHGRGLMGVLMGAVARFTLAVAGEPSIHLVGDSVLTGTVKEALAHLAPDVVVMPAGAANMGVGGDILFSLDETCEVIRSVRGRVILNHMEALDHCPVTRDQARERVRAMGCGGRVFVPEDGEDLSLS